MPAARHSPILPPEIADNPFGHLVEDGHRVMLAQVDRMSAQAGARSIRAMLLMMLLSDACAERDEWEPRSNARRYALLHETAARGLASARIELAGLCANGPWRFRSDVRASVWLSTLAESSPNALWASLLFEPGQTVDDARRCHASASVGLATLCRSGRVDGHGDEHALALYRQGAAEGEVRGAWGVFSMLKSGLGTRVGPREIEEAGRQLGIAARQHHPQATLLHEAYRTEARASADCARAWLLYQCWESGVYARRALIGLLLTGDALVRDPERARRLQIDSDARGD